MAYITRVALETNCLTHATLHVFSPSRSLSVVLSVALCRGRALRLFSAPRTEEVSGTFLGVLVGLLINTRSGF